MARSQTTSGPLPAKAVVRMSTPPSCSRSLSYTTKTFTSFTLNTESTYDWQGHQWTVPVNVMVQQLVKIGKQPVAFQLGYRYYAEKPDDGPDWGLRFAVTFLFPKKS